jgi:quinol-cytochrome oxidoreductase complex cytochrome b subunit
MATFDISSFLMSLIPFLNAGLVILIIDLALRSKGFEVTAKEFQRKPLNSLFWALCLILISNVTYLIIQGTFSQAPPVVFSFFLLLIYFAIVLNMTPKKHRSPK